MRKRDSYFRPSRATRQFRCAGGTQHGKFIEIDSPGYSVAVLPKGCPVMDPRSTPVIEGEVTHHTETYQRTNFWWGHEGGEEILLTPTWMDLTEAERWIKMLPPPNCYSVDDLVQQNIALRDRLADLSHQYDRALDRAARAESQVARVKHAIEDT